MTYTAGGPIEATDYNSFTTLSTGVNELYADNYSGATSLPAAGFGYGQSPLTAVAPGDTVQASEWTSLFQVMRSCGAHQGTTVSPPVPSTDPASGDLIIAENVGATLDSTISLLQANRHALSPGQTTLTLGTANTSTSSWYSLLTYSFQADFGSWNNARYFFNSGGSLQIVSEYSSASSPVELTWKNALETRSPFVFNWQSTTPAAGTNSAPLHPIGFWKVSTSNPLTTSYQVVYNRSIDPGVYSNSFIEIEAKLNAVAGTNGLVDFKVNLTDGDAVPNIKSAGIAFTINNAKSSGAIVYPGPAVVITNLGFTYT